MEIIMKYEINSISDVKNYYEKTREFIEDKDMMKMLCDRYGLKEKTTQKIYDYIYGEHHSCYGDMLDYLREAFDLIIECVKIEKDN